MRISCSSTSVIPSETANSIQVLMTCQGFVEAQYDVDLCVPGEGGVDFEGLREHYGLSCAPFPIQRLASRPFLRRLDFSLAALNQAKKSQADVIYTWTIQIAALAALQGRKAIYELHNLPAGSFGKRWFKFFTGLKAPKRVLFISKELMNQTRKLYPALSAHECMIAPMGICLRDYADLPPLNEAKKALGFPEDRLVVSCSGHLYQGRGAELFLSLAEAFPQLDFRWFGGNPQEVAKYQATSAARGLTNVIFSGFIPKAQLPLRQAASDIVLMPYGKTIAGSSGGNTASFCSPMKMFEYMAVGRAILSSDIPVIHEVLDERSAVFCLPDDEASWREGLARLSNDQSLRLRLGARAKEKAADYTWQKRAEDSIRSIMRE